MPSLEPYKIPMQPIPERMEAALAVGVVSGQFPAAAEASQLFDRWDEFADRTLRSPDGRLLVTCSTDMPGVTPDMIDWWFAWHLTESERYQLWHPLAHLKAVVEEDRSGLADNRAIYRGNISYVDEYIGKELKHLAIAFFEPSEIGLAELEHAGATAICARTTDRQLRAEGGRLVHLVSPTETGCEMRSAFWLGEAKLKIPLLGALLTPLANTGPMRRLIVKDHLATDLQRHCAEEMNHLARFLPQLYNEANKDR